MRYENVGKLISLRAVTVAASKATPVATCYLSSICVQLPPCPSQTDSRKHTTPPSVLHISVVINVQTECTHVDGT